MMQCETGPGGLSTASHSPAQATRTAAKADNLEARAGSRPAALRICARGPAGVAVGLWSELYPG